MMDIYFNSHKCLRKTMKDKQVGIGNVLCWKTRVSSMTGLRFESCYFSYYRSNDVV